MMPPQGAPQAPMAPRAPGPQGPMGQMPVNRPDPGGMGMQAPPLRRPLPPPEPMMAPNQRPVNMAPPQAPPQVPSQNMEYLGDEDGGEDDYIRQMTGAAATPDEIGRLTAMYGQRQGYPGDAAMRLRGMTGAAATPYEVGQFPARPPRPGAMGQGSTLARLLMQQQGR